MNLAPSFTARRIKLLSALLTIVAVPIVLMAETKPDSISGLKLWFRADSGTFKDDAATVAAQPGDPVAAWKNQSGTANATTPEPIAKRRPVLTANIFNGKPALRFDGVDDLMKLPSNVFGTNDTGITVFAVFKTKVADGGLISAYHDASTYQYALVVKDGKGQFMCRDKDIINPPFEFPINTTASVNSDDVVILSAVYDGKVKRLFKNGVSQVPDGVESHSGPGNLETENLLHCIGMQGYELHVKDAPADGSDGFTSQWAHYFNGFIAEIIIYNGALDAKDREAMERSLRSKYVAKE